MASQRSLTHLPFVRRVAVVLALAAVLEPVLARGMRERWPEGAVDYVIGVLSWLFVAVIARLAGFIANEDIDRPIVEKWGPRSVAWVATVAVLAPLVKRLLDGRWHDSVTDYLFAVAAWLGIGLLLGILKPWWFWGAKRLRT